MSRLPSSAPRGNARIRILGIDQPEPVAATRGRLPVLPVILLIVAMTLGITLVLRPDDPQPAPTPAPLSQPSSKIVLMATAEHAAFVPSPRVARVMAAVTTTHANLASAARHAARSTTPAVSPEAVGTPGSWPVRSTTTTEPTVTVAAPPATTSTGTTIGPEAPPNPAIPSQIDTP